MKRTILYDVPRILTLLRRSPDVELRFLAKNQMPICVLVTRAAPADFRVKDIQPPIQDAAVMEQMGHTRVNNNSRSACKNSSQRCKVQRNLLISARIAV